MAGKVRVGSSVRSRCHAGRPSHLSRYINRTWPVYCRLLNAAWAIFFPPDTVFPNEKACMQVDRWMAAVGDA